MSARSLGLKKRWARGEVTFGAWLGLSDPAVAEIMAVTGFDFVFIDAEHGNHTLASLPTTLMAFNGHATVPIVRVPWNDAVTIKSVLDAGADGVIAPMIMNAEETRALTRASFYPPDGARGFGPLRASAYYRDTAEYAATANQSIIVIPQIEHVDAARKAEDIVAVPGVAAVLIGPNDMSGTAGVLGQLDHPAVTAGVEQVAAAAAKHGIPACIGAVYPPEEAAAWARRGATMVNTSLDAGILAEGATRALRTATEAAAS